MRTVRQILDNLYFDEGDNLVLLDLLGLFETRDFFDSEKFYHYANNLTAKDAINLNHRIENQITQQQIDRAKDL